MNGRRILERGRSGRYANFYSWGHLPIVDVGKRWESLWLYAQGPLLGDRESVELLVETSGVSRL